MQTRSERPVLAAGHCRSYLRGTDQEEKACTRDVQRFCRKLMDQGDLTILACLKENRARLSLACRYVLVSHGQ